MKFSLTNTRTRMHLLSSLAAAMLALTSCETENATPASKTDHNVANAPSSNAGARSSSSNAVASSSYSSIYGPTVSCPGAIENYTYTFRSYNMMRPLEATLTVTGGVFLPSGTTSITYTNQAGSREVQVQWNGPGSLNGVYKWTTGTPGAQVYYDYTTLPVTMDCAQ